jgi:Tol biopolymer transport system component
MAATSPDTREITDPKKITAAEMTGAGPVPMDDLFYTRSTGGGAWSPDGKEVVFTSNFTGRLNVWKVNSAGGWPIQLSQSDDRQGSAAWSPDGKWIIFQSDRGGAEIYDLFAIPANGGEIVNLTDHRAEHSRKAQLDLLDALGPDGIARQYVKLSQQPAAQPPPCRLAALGQPAGLE